jgi:hypothetical protein
MQNTIQYRGIDPRMLRMKETRNGRCLLSHGKLIISSHQSIH